MSYFSLYQKLCIVFIYLLNCSDILNPNPTCQAYVLREALGNDTYRVWMTPPPDRSSIRDVRYYQATDSFKQCYNESERKDGCIFVEFGWQYFYIRKGQSIVIDGTTFMDADDIFPLLGNTTSTPTEGITSSPTKGTTSSPTEGTTSSPTESTELYSGHPAVYVFLVLLCAVCVILIAAVIVLSFCAYSFWKRLKVARRSSSVVETAPVMQVDSSSDVAEETTQSSFGIEEENRQPSPSRSGATHTATNRAESDGVVTRRSSSVVETAPVTQVDSSSDVAEETSVVTHENQSSLSTPKKEAGASETTQTTLL